MDKLRNLLTYWRSLELGDYLCIAWVVIMLFFNKSISGLFANFIESKPAGRKTVMGKIYIQKPPNFCFNCVKFKKIE